MLAAQALQEIKSFDTQAQAKRNVGAVVERVAVCRKCYIHPAVLNAYLDGSLVQTLKQRAADMAKSMSNLRPQEAAVLALLQRRLAGSN